MEYPVSITLDKDNYQAPSDIPGLENYVIGKEARSIIAEQWKEHNREGMEEAARFIALNGSFADDNRN